MAARKTSAPVDRAAALALRAEGLTQAAIAARLACSKSAVGNVLRRVRLCDLHGAPAPEAGAPPVAAARALLDLGMAETWVARLQGSSAALPAARALPAGPRPRLRLRGRGKLHWVEAVGPAGAVAVSAPVDSRELAQARLDLIAARAAERERACLSCRAIFVSEGAHNRLCGECRQRDSGPGVCGVHFEGHMR
jgi:hypothetical protein